MRWKVLGIAIFAVLIAWFTLVNSVPVSVDFLVVTAQTNLVFVILISALLGMCLMTVLWLPLSWKLRRANRHLRREMEDVQDELENVSGELAGYQGTDAEASPSSAETELVTHSDSVTQIGSASALESTSTSAENDPKPADHTPLRESRNE